MKLRNPLLAVSNRVLPFRDKQAGGLAIALGATMDARGGRWFGWSGEISGRVQVTCEERGGVRYLSADFTDRDDAEHYATFANRSLWPLLHSRPDLIVFSDVSWEGYNRVNRRIAGMLAKEAASNEVLWVHDYHLIPLAQWLRANGMRNRIGFFLHVPFPDIEMIANLPCHKELFSTLSSYDLVGFQTSHDLENFIDYMTELHQTRCIAINTSDGQSVYRVEMTNGTMFRAGVYPISIDTSLMAAQSALALTDTPVRQLKESLGGSSLILGVDRVDYSKGLPARFEAYRAFLEGQREGEADTTFLQIAPLSRTDVSEYQDLRSQLEGQAGSINSGLSRPDWTPLRYVNQNFDQRTLAGFYRLAKVGMVTPLRDGMNLVAKEFVACQDPADPGVLILSRSAGAANELTDALLVNPLDVEEVAQAIAQALSMSLFERKARWSRMMKRLQDWDVHAWADAFLSQLGESASEPPMFMKRLHLSEPMRALTAGTAD